MQNKGFVKFLAVALTLICIFYLSFSVVTNVVENKASKMSEEDAELYLDSLSANKFYLGSYNLKQCRETAIGLGLDLKGGMNVMLEVSVPDVVKALANHSTDSTFVASIDEATKEAVASQEDFITLFVKAFKKNAPDGRVLKSDVIVAKNYLSQDQVKDLERAVVGYFDYIEGLIKRHITFTMKEFVKSVNGFLEFNRYDILEGQGSVSREQADEKAFAEYEEFNKTQKIISDFDLEIKKLSDSKA